MEPAHYRKGRLFVAVAIIATLILLAASCLKEMPETFPENLEWNPAIAFPLGENSYGLNAASGFDTSLLELDTISGWPAWVDELEVVLDGTMEFSLAAISNNVDQINRMMFRVNLFNGFPNVVLAQAYFRDAAMNTIDSMFREGPMIAAPGMIGGDGKTVQPTHTRQDAVFNRDRIRLLENATTILFQATIPVSGVDSTLVPFYPDYQLDVRIGTMLDLSFTF